MKLTLRTLSRLLIVLLFLGILTLGIFAARNFQTSGHSETVGFGEMKPGNNSDSSETKQEKTNTVSSEGFLNFIPYRFQRVRAFSNGLAAIRRNKHWGYINRKGDVKIQARFTAARDFNNGIAFVRQSNEWGYIDKSGKPLTPFQYDFTSGKGFFSNGRAAVQKNGNWGYINRDGEIVVELQYNWAFPFKEGLAAVEQNGRYGFINRHGDTVIPPTYRDASSFSEGFAAVRTDKGWGFINRDGQLVIRPRFDWVFSFHEDRAAILKAGKWGFINSKGKQIVDPQFEAVGDFHNNRAWVRTDKGVGFIRSDGTFVVDPQYKAAESYRGGKAPVYDGEHWGYINRAGETEIKPSFRTVVQGRKLKGVLTDDGWNYLTSSGKMLLENSIEVTPSAGVTKDSPVRGLWYEEREQKYVKSLTSNETWRLDRDPNASEPGMYLVNRYPHQEPTPLQRFLAHYLHSSSLKAARVSGWYSRPKALREGFKNKPFQDRYGAHHFKVENLFEHERVPDPMHPEFLMYYPTPDGRKLASFMYMTLSRDYGPQIGGPLTLWHFHRHPKTRVERCQDNESGRISWPVESCEQLEPDYDTYQMLHVWLVKHPNGPFSSSINLSRALMENLVKGEYYPVQ